MKIKHLLNGVAIVAALAIAAPVWAQGYPGPSPRGGQYGGSGYGINPGSTSAPAAAMPASTQDATSATPSKHRRAHHVTHAAAHHKAAPLAGSTASQLNQQELARVSGR